MGTGKTFIAAAAAHLAGFKRVLVLCPPHLVPKWKREVEMTVPGARAVIVKSITDLERLRLSTGSGPLFAVMSREKAKLSYRWMPAVIQRWAVSKGRLLRDEETGEPFRVPCCPDCTAQIVDKDGVPFTDEDLNRRKHTCANCGSPLWQADKSGPARYPLADYVKHHMKGFFDLLGKSLSLSGTLMGGYSSTLFHLLYRFSPEIRTDFGRSDEHRWIQRYGFEEHTVGKPDDDSVEDGRFSRRRKYRKVVRERPGLVPSYKNTLQADALKLVAKKLQSSLAVEGDLPEDGLAAYGDDGDDLMMALARKIVSGDEEEDETVEAVFAQARDAEATAEELLVDDGWKVVESLPRAGHGSSRRPSRSTVTATATTTRPRSRSRRCSPGRSSWPRSRQAEGTGRQGPARNPVPVRLGAQP